MTFAHRTFLLWLVYIAIVIFSFGLFTYLDIPRTVVRHDHSYLSLLLFAMYGLAEVLAARQAWAISKQNLIADRAREWLKSHHVEQVKIGDSVVFCAADDRLTLPASTLSQHIAALHRSSDADRHAQNSALLELTADQIYEKATIGDFIGNRIVWIGILATILGVILAFWPMINGMSLDAMKSNLGAFFGGIAVAFIPTALSFLFKIYLDFNTVIIESGVRSLLHTIAEVCDTALPLIRHSKADL